ncbi:MAG: phosphoglycerate dehydrogenase [Candidatus Omnitrophota bacterium]
MRILVSDPLSDEGLKILKEQQDLEVVVKTKLSVEELKKEIKGYNAIIIRSGTTMTKEIIDAADNLRIIGRAGTGVDNVDVEAASRKGIIVMNTPGGNTISTAEHTMSLLLSISRNIPQAHASLKKGAWERKKFIGVEVYGKILGIVGLGRIGTEVAKRANAFGMKIIAYDPFFSVDKARQLKVELTNLEDLLKRADYITVHTPLTAETKHLIGKEEFQLMKFGVRVINCARGGIIDEKALDEALESGKVAAAALDVYENEPPEDSPILKRDNVVTTPHLGASTEEAQEKVAVDICKQVVDALSKGIVVNAVNIPSMDTELLKILEPYMKICQRLGSAASQLAKDSFSEIKITYYGEILNYDTTMLTLAAVKGVFEPILQSNVNFVNAMVIAKERGISVVDTKESISQDFTNLIKIELKGKEETIQVSGTLFTKSEPRIVRINEYYVEAIPAGFLLVMHNMDVPGIVGQIGSILGKNNINIAGMTFGRIKQGGKAISVLNVDSIVPQAVINEILHSKNILDAKLVKL